MSRDVDRQRVYDAERFAFEDTPLADLIREEEVQASYRAVFESPSWIWGDVDIVSARVDMVNHGGRASGTRVITSAGRIHRYTVSHELAHVLVRRYGCFDHGHGPAFRRLHLYTVGSIFGEEYQDLLLQAYTSHQLPVDRTPLRLPIVSVPIINIDAMSIATAPTGGWSRS